MSSFASAPDDAVAYQQSAWHRPSILAVLPLVERRKAARSPAERCTWFGLPIAYCGFCLDDKTVRETVVGKDTLAV